MTDAHEDLDPVRVCERLITTAKLLYAQCEGCVVNHYAHDFATQGAPGWLADCAADIEAAQALGARAMKAACEAAGAKPVATVRVTHAGFGMELSTHVAYALPEGSHNLYAHPPAVAAGG